MQTWVGKGHLKVKLEMPDRDCSMGEHWLAVSEGSLLKDDPNEVLNEVLNDDGLVITIRDRNGRAKKRRGAHRNAHRDAPTLQKLQVRNVGNHGSSGVNVSVEAGELIAVIGPSGAGKSTLLHLLAALDTPTSGTVYFEKKAIDSFRESELADYRNASIGFVWQRHHLLADFTAAENVAMPLLMRGAGYSEALETSARWLREVGLEARTKHRAGELSGGEQQRVAIARALVQRTSHCCWPMNPPEIWTSETQLQSLS